MAVRRNGGFTEAQISVEIASDRRFRYLKRNAPIFYQKAHHSYILHVIECWREGQRLTFIETWNELMYPMSSMNEIQAGLIEAGYLDVNGQVPIEKWERWYGRAEAARNAHLDTSARGGLTKSYNRHETRLEELAEVPKKELTAEQKIQVAESKAALKELSEKLGMENRRAR